MLGSVSTRPPPRPPAARRRTWTEGPPRPGRPARHRSGGRWLRRSRRPSPRPPSGYRAGALHLGPQQFDLHREFADPLHGRRELAVSWVSLALLQRPLPCRLRLLPPLLELEQRQAELAREQLGRLAAHQPQHHLALARRAPALARRQPASAACGQRGRAAPALADHRPISRIKRIDLVHPILHHSGLPSDKWVSR